MDDIEMLDEDFYEVFPEEETNTPSNLVSIESFFEGVKNNTTNIANISITLPSNEIISEEENSDVDTIFSQTSDNIDILPQNTIFSLSNETENEEIIEDVFDKEKEEKKQKIITRVQIGLIVFLLFSATLIYFFGYDFFEPYIKID